MKIKKLTIYTSKVKRQLQFYRDELNFQVRDYDETSFELLTGYSILRFEYRENAKPYHIAFHIPDNQEEEALRWIENERSALPNNNQKIIDFSNWGAKSVYFYDEDKNIMELISRRDFSKPKSAIFSADSIVGVAEIGLATVNIQEKFKKMQTECGLVKFDGDLERFCAVGEASGLIITINKNEKVWFPTGDKAFSADFILEFEYDQTGYSMSFKEDQLEISKK
ncbi:VOC family protein [Christiangramia salexigens]|uniref:Glyoxalase n=1 Tax=Christiangramia salexigens TaxID=1913577 RepID=A0A1L3J1I8_9FLAO|nr:glyoxalase [Christiangramia salexigens]APG58978.1 glyoxalase [Christiangramia salexigens]